MSITAYQQPADVQLKVVTVNKEQTQQNRSGLSSSKIFTISFSYQNRAYRTKVMKVLYSNKEPMYKVVMPCSDITENCIYWLQRDDNTWNVVIGDEMDAKLLKAVTSAIDCLE